MFFASKALLIAIWLHFTSQIVIKDQDLFFYHQGNPVQFSKLQTSGDFTVGMGNYSGSGVCPVFMNRTNSSVEVAIDLQFDASVSVRAYAQSQSLQDGSFLIYSQKSINLTTDWRNFTAVLPQDASITIVGAQFRDSSDQFVVVVKKLTSPSTGHYEILSIKNTTTQGFVVPPVSMTQQLDELTYQNSSIYISFSSGVYVYNCSNPANMTSLVAASFSPAQLQSIDMTVGPDLLCYFVVAKVICYSVPNYHLLYNVSFSPERLMSVLTYRGFVFMVSNTTIRQFDLSSPTLIHSLPYALNSNIKARIFGPTASFVLYDAKGTAQGLTMFSFTYDYTNGTNCASYYTYTNSKCVRNFGPYPHGTIAHPDRNWSLLIYNTGEAKPEDTSSAVTEEQGSMVEDLMVKFPFVNFQTIKQAVTPMGTALAAVSTPLSPSFFVLFTGFLDDMWFYRYHRYKYPDTLVFFTEEISIVNQLRLSPNFMSFMTFVDESALFSDRNSGLKKYAALTADTDPDAIYFLNSTEPIYKSNFIMSFMFYFVAKILYVFAFCLRKRIRQKGSRCFCKVVKSVVGELKRSSLEWLCAASFMESSLPKLTYACWLQLSHFLSFDFFDKIDAIATVLSLFVVILYCLCFYVLCYAFLKQDQSKLILTKCQDLRLRVFFFESISNVCRSVSRSFVHSFFIFNYPLQIRLLAVVDLFCLIFCIRMRGCFEKTIDGLIYIAYLAAMFLLDSLLAAKYLMAEHFNSEMPFDYSLAVLILILLLVFTTFLGMLFAIGCEGYKLVRYLVRRQLIVAQITNQFDKPVVVQENDHHKISEISRASDLIVKRRLKFNLLNINLPSTKKRYIVKLVDS